MLLMPTADKLQACEEASLRMAPILARHVEVLIEHENCQDLFEHETEPRHLFAGLTSILSLRFNILILYIQHP